jgi:hypothetical protein
MPRYKVTMDNRDANEPEIVAALEKLGCKVLRIKSTFDPGVPDLIVIVDGITCFVEVKVPGAKLKPSQIEFRDYCHFHDVPWFQVNGVTQTLAEEIDTPIDSVESLMNKLIGKQI